MNSSDRDATKKTPSTNGDGEPIEEGDRSRAKQQHRSSGDGREDDSLPKPSDDSNLKEGSSRYSNGDGQGDAPRPVEKNI
jgi:hypothetical protein